MEDSEFLYHKCYKIDLNCGGSWIDTPDLIKNKKETINLVNKKDDKCFQYTINAALNHEEVERHPERITKIKHFLNI